MAAMSEERKKYESAFMTDFWKLRKDNAVPEESDEYWEMLMQKYNELVYKYGQDPFIVAIASACVFEIESRSHPNEIRMEKIEGNIEKHLNEIRTRYGLQKMRIVYESGRET